MYKRMSRPTTEQAQPFGPKEPDHPSIGEPCLACGVPFKAGDLTCLIALGPGDDPEAQDKAQRGSWYNALSIELHWACAGGKMPSEEEQAS